ncbi:hypothetical protein VPNG_08954 [Cytospora leucostoma]|uniref:Uncharacterized protein n=1 Tax=Cytospora leucostoma TaxID=1230097 RepID=A0A423VVZ9_9PEZI|nr:hypothetical protein VPNG_08954 [Cytospora leucostoma]
MKAFFSALIVAVATVVITTMASPLSLRGTAPAPVGGNLTWCTTNPNGNCTLGIRHDFDSKEIDAYMFDHDCNLLNSTDKLVPDSPFLFTWPGPGGDKQVGTIYVSDSVSYLDIFLFNGAAYQSGWDYQNPLLVEYEQRSFDCGS